VLNPATVKVVHGVSAAVTVSLSRVGVAADTGLVRLAAGAVPAGKQFATGYPARVLLASRSQRVRKGRFKVAPTKRALGSGELAFISGSEERQQSCIPACLKFRGARSQIGAIVDLGLLSQLPAVRKYAEEDH